MQRRARSYGMLGLFVIIGAVMGGILGELVGDVEAFSGIAPYLSRTRPIIDISPIVIDLYVLKLSFGFSFYPNIVSIFGVLLAIFLCRRN